MCKLPSPITHKHDASANLAPLAYVYIYITQNVTKFNDQRSSPPLLVRHPWSAERNSITRPWDWFVLDASLCQLTRWYTWCYDLVLWKLKAKTAKMHWVCKVSLPGTPLSCMLKVNGFSLNPQTPQTLFHLIRKVETCCSNAKVLKFPGFAITANCSSRGQITFTLPIGIQFQSFLKHTFSVLVATKQTSKQTRPGKTGKRLLGLVYAEPLSSARAAWRSTPEQSKVKNLHSI